MKKILVFILALMMMIGTIGCSAEQKDNTAESTTAAAQTTASSETTASGEKIKIGIVQHVDHPSLNQIRETIISELEAAGMSDKIEIVFENANGDASLLPSIMQSLVNDNVSMIVPIATPTAQAAAAVTTTIPIVFSAVSNPVEAGLVTSFDAVDGNITGVSNSIAIEDIFALAAELTPEAKTFGFVYNSSEINSVTGINRAKVYCDANGIAYKEVTITGTADLQQAATSLVGEVDAFFTPNDNMVASAMPVYLQVATDAGLPIYVGADSMVNDGGLATVGIDYTVLGKQTADMIIRIVNGEQISENPVEVINQYAKMINFNTANTLGITIPDEIKDDFVIIGE
jgi:putative ABC transport system substrate-binding protein